MLRLLVSLASLAAAFALPARADNIADVRATIEAHYRAINGEEGEVRDPKDVEIIRAHHLADYTLFPWHGGLLREAGWRDASQRMGATAEFQSNSNLRMTSFRAQIYGNVAVATFYLVGTLDGQRLTNRVSAVWVKTEGDWREAHHHESPLLAGGIP